MQDSNDILRRLHEIYQGPLPEGAPIRTPSSPLGRTFMFRDAQPGTAEFARLHYLPPADEIEVWGPIGPEDFGPVAIHDGKTGKFKRRVEH